jgi:hypothetical protein
MRLPHHRPLLLGTTGVFTTTLREALLRGAVDLVVHSCKDLPTAPGTGAGTGAVPGPRGPARRAGLAGRYHRGRIAARSADRHWVTRRAALLRATGAGGPRQGQLAVHPRRQQYLNRGQPQRDGGQQRLGWYPAGTEQAECVNPAGAACPLHTA